MSPISPNENRKIIETAVCLQLSWWQICTVPTVRVETLTNYPCQAKLFSKNYRYLARTNVLGLLLSPKIQHYDVKKKKSHRNVSWRTWIQFRPLLCTVNSSWRVTLIWVSPTSPHPYILLLFRVDVLPSAEPVKFSPNHYILFSIRFDILPRPGTAIFNSFWRLTLTSASQLQSTTFTPCKILPWLQGVSSPLCLLEPKVIL